MAVFNLDEYRRQFQQTMDARGAASAAQLGAVFAELRAQLQGMIDPALFAAVETAQAVVSEAAQVERRAIAEYTGLEGAPDGDLDGWTDKLMRLRAVRDGAGIRHRQARDVLTRAQQALTTTAQGAFLAEHQRLVGVADAATREAAAKVDALRKEFEEAERQAWAPAKEARAVLERWRMLNEEVGVDGRQLATLRERATHG